MTAFALSFGVIFLAELGDKSQLMALAFAARYRAATVLVAVAIATLLVHAGSVLLGSAFALALPTGPIQVAAGIAF
ncbi:MAG TPA: TMEM165/GDT1 family protein, partial [Candidatus Limnocylindrales bacterium]|nr:TMEM165/GDT1 family protein [Candidatus Limnocylindrales bacterium]